MKRTEVREFLKDKGLRTITDNLVTILCYLSEHQGESAQKVYKGLKGEIEFATINTTMRRAKAKGVLTRNNFLNLNEKDKEKAVGRKYKLTKEIREGLLPDPKYKWVHVASYLSQFKDEDIIPDPYFKGATKTQWLIAFNNWLARDETLQNEVKYKTHEYLAIMALVTKELDAFKDMQGTITLPEE